jgi:radical SAM protein with 4Fe4S-binding SPASM domain
MQELAFSNRQISLDPELILKNDIDRVVLLTRSQPLSSRNSVCYLLHPIEAVVFALFGAGSTVDEVGAVWAEITQSTSERALSDVKKIINHYTSGSQAKDKLFVEVSNENRNSIRVYDPADFAIPHEKVNITDRRLRKPYSVYFLPTLFCPQKCIYCYADRAWMPEDDLLSIHCIRRIFSDLKEIGVESIQFSGGEVFARKDIFEIFEAAAENGLAMDIPTKSKLSSEDTYRLADIGIKKIQFSLDAVDSVTLETMVGLKNYLDTAMFTLVNLKNAGISVRVNCVLTSINVEKAHELIAFLGCMEHVYELRFTPYGRSIFRHSDSLFVEKEQLTMLNEKVLSLSPLYPHMNVRLGSLGYEYPKMDLKEKWNAFENRAYCTAGRDGFVILPDGRVTVCEELYYHPSFIIGDLKRQSVMEMWNSSEALALIYPDQRAIPDGTCKICEHFVECNTKRGRCWRDVLKSYGWDNSHFPDPKCPMAPPAPRLS